MPTPSENEHFIREVIGNDALEDAVEWIGQNLDPADVFSYSQLEEWALDNGFAMEEDE